MHIENLVRLVETFNPAQLQDAAILYLRMRGFQNPELSDGWSDGGTDVRVLNAINAKSKIAIQVSVEKKWKAKISEDLRKAIENYEIESFIYISSRRLPELEFEKTKDKLKEETGVAIERVDGQSLASAFFTEGRTSELLKIGGIHHNEEIGYSSKESSFVNQALFSYLFFSDDIRDFRERILDSITLAYLSENENTSTSRSVNTLSRGIAQETFGSSQKSSAFASTIDRLLQDGSILASEDGLKLSQISRDHVETSRALNEREWTLLIEKIMTVLRRELPNISDAEVDEVVRFLGATATGVGTSAKGAFGTKDASSLKHHLRKRIAELDSMLHSLGAMDDNGRRALISDLMNMTTSSQAGKALAASEVFGFLSSLTVTELSAAFGGHRTNPNLILDSNVAIPMLLNLYYGAGTTRFFASAKILHSLVSETGLQLSLPQDYLEEAAFHLIQASRQYPAVVDYDDDLRMSTNAYVAHYVTLRKAGHPRTFLKYLAGLGATSELLGQDSRTARNQLMIKLRHLFARYGVEICFSDRPDQIARVAAEGEFSIAAKSLGRQRANILARHDANIIAHLQETMKSSPDYPILVTWDRVFHGLNNDNDHWVALDPATTVDLLSMTDTKKFGSPLASATVIAMSLSEEDAEKGAQVTDWLVRSNLVDLADADQRDIALRFKSEHLRHSADNRDSVLREAWDDWRKSE
ncbi:restriction endonuclease [Actinomadura mexicana]|uniref:Restriction endonuclease n=1 Tax=Actinomadura mexicana TaxID=134959 RepID=A0A239AB37_9ACTN|nr:restriction endonuclease [Actinomadura mexicana]SNR92876.1 hypothetical protein SAMN06265355_108332 [Actinomadura mexicana]